MRKATLLFAAMALALVAAAGAALAIDKQCTLNPCYGTNGRDILYERSGNGAADTIYGKAGNDLIRAETFAGSNRPDRDRLYGQEGNDRLNAGRGGDGADLLVGGRGFDECKGDRATCSAIAK